MQGLDGGILIGAETTYDTEASSKVAQLAISSTLGPRRVPIRTRSRLTSYASRTRQGPSYVDGEIVAGFTLSDSIIGGVLGLLGSDSAVAGTYVIGTGSQDNASASVAINHGGTEYTYTGCVPQSFRLELGQEDAIYTLSLAGRTVAEEASVTSFTDPSESALLLPASYGTLSIDSADYDFSSFSLEISCPVDFLGKTSVGASQVRRAFLAGAFEISGSVTLELDDDAANDMDTVTLLDNAVSSGDGNLASITMGSWLTLSSCQLTGDWPSLQAGAQEFSLSFNAQTAAIVTS